MVKLEPVRLLFPSRLPSASRLQRFSGERLLCLGTVQQHPQDGWHAVRKGHLFALKKCDDSRARAAQGLALFLGCVSSAAAIAATATSDSYCNLRTHCDITHWQHGTNVDGYQTPCCITGEERLLNLRDFTTWVYQHPQLRLRGAAVLTDRISQKSHAKRSSS